MPTDWKAWRQAYPLASKEALFAEVLADSGTTGALSVALPDPVLPWMRDARHDAGDPAIIGVGADAEGTQSTQDLEDIVRRTLAKVLAVPVDRVAPGGRLSSLGFDSLMATETSAILLRDLGLEVPVMRMLGDSTLRDVIAAVAGQRRAADDGRYS